MSDQERFDTRLAALFEQEHRQVSAEAFVAETMRRIRAGRRRQEIMRYVLRGAALAAIVVASPWLTAGVEHLNSALESPLTWVAGPPGKWVLAGLAFVVVTAMRLHRR